MTARQDAIAAAGRTIAAGRTLRDSLPPRAAAEAAWTPSGPSVDELELMIRAQRGEQVEAPENVTALAEAARFRRSRTSTDRKAAA